jgi:hypothetical protein
MPFSTAPLLARRSAELLLSRRCCTRYLTQCRKSSLNRIALLLKLRNHAFYVVQ